MISVIVPIYNVEKTIQKCLDSLAEQTIEDVEFLLIDDGSTDRSGELADLYGSDARFHIFHTLNQGLSAARNIGIDNANGEWIMFVDSDDYVDSQYCELPFLAAKRYEADLVCFDYSEKGKQKKSLGNKQVGIVDEYTAFELTNSAAWNKLYKRDLFLNIRYPEGKIYEDYLTTHKLIHLANRIAVIPDCLYHHTYRKGSISNTNSSMNNLSRFIAIQERKYDLISYGYPEEKLKNLDYEAAIRYITRTSPRDNNQFFIQACNIVNNIEGVPKSLSFNQKIALVLWKTSKVGFYLIARLSGRLKE